MRTISDVIDRALSDWVPRAAQPGAAVFGAAGSAGQHVHPDLEGWTISAHHAYGEIDPFHRMFATQVGQTAVQAVGNETRTLGAMLRVAVEIVAESLKRSRQVAKEDRLIVVAGDGHQAPLVLVMSPSMATASASHVISDMVDLPLDALVHCLPFVADSHDNTPESFVMRTLLSGGHRAVSETFLVTQPEVVATRRPRMVRLSVPTPHVSIQRDAELSTAGIYCRDTEGVLGVTGCYHGTGPVGTKVLVGGRESLVKWANEVQDIVFIPLTDGQIPAATRARAGVRRDREPARADRSSFDGATNQNRSTRIFGADHGLLRQRPTIMLKVQTDPDTDRGDSGCALVDEYDQVLGFAFERTAYDDYPQFSDWIWAANALTSLGLSPI